MTYPDSIFDGLVLIKGAGDLATGVALRLFRCGFRIAMTEIPEPMMVRRTVSFSEAVYNGTMVVEGVEAVRVVDCPQALRVIADGKIPVLVDPLAACRCDLHPAVLIDAIMAKQNIGTGISDAPLVIALGPGFTAGVDCHAVIETNRGHRLGRVIDSGSAEPNTGQPGEVGGKSTERLLRAPVDGVVEAVSSIGDMVNAGQTVAQVDGVPVKAEIPGVLRGMIRSGIRVPAGTKIGDVDPRADIEDCYQASDKSLAIAGGVLESIFTCQPHRFIFEKMFVAVSSR
jgi:xanthine dehydrogenase accessory factor